VPSTTQARLEVSRDLDVFQFVLTQAATVSITTTGSLDTRGTLWDASGQTLAEDEDLGVGLEFPHPPQVGGRHLPRRRPGLNGFRDGDLRSPDHPV